MQDLRITATPVDADLHAVECSSCGPVAIFYGDLLAIEQSLLDHARSHAPVPGVAWAHG